jgi:glycosyltransferase involved in cell wall biosynthesis
MRVMVAIDNRFEKTQDGNYYSTTVCDHNFWKRYLEVFDEVIVFARVKNIFGTITDKAPANGPGVSFFELPTYVGPWEYLKYYFQLKKLSRKAVDSADAFILRVPGGMGSLLWRALIRRKIPYSVEVIANFSDSIVSCGVNYITQLIVKILFGKNQLRQCQGAAASAYVTEKYLQSLYPPKNWTTHYSSIELTKESFISPGELEQKMIRLKDAVDGKRPFKICHIGTMGALYKAQDKLIEAVSVCRAKGHDMKLSFLGSGKYQDYFAQKAEELGMSKQVEFLGQVAPGKAVRDLLDSSDIFVLPSMTEGLPRALIEAMARGLPCIGTRIAGIPELLDPDSMIDAGNTKMLTEKLVFLCHNLDKLSKMAERNCKVAQNYDTVKLNERRVKFYAKVKEITKNSTDKQCNSKY